MIRKICLEAIHRATLRILPDETLDKKNIKEGASPGVAMAATLIE